MSSNNARIGIIGASGYGGAELARLLALHPRANVQAATASGDRAGAKLADLFPSLRGVCDVVCEEYDAARIADQCDLAFVALPHGAALQIVPELLQLDCKVVDLGADFRLRDANDYQQWYKLTHTAPQAQAEAVYGLPEFYRAAVKTARLVANPGCYPTSAILALAPFVAAGEVQLDSIIVDSASGTSGSGRSSFGIGMHHPEVHADYKAYNVGAHRHTPEIEQSLHDALPGGSAVARPVITFTAHLLPVSRGILSTCYATVNGSLTTEKALSIIAERYRDEPFVRLCAAGQFPQIKHVVGSNFCDIGVHVDGRTQRLIVVSAIDNLVKGAAGQAIQNMNLLLGFAETDGLLAAPVFP